MVQAIRDEHVITSVVAAPFRTTTKLYRNLSSNRGFELIASVMATYCAALSIEAMYVAMPNFSLNRSDYLTKAEFKAAQVEYKRSLRFVPKPGIDDGAKLVRIVPFATMQNWMVDRSLTPQWFRNWAYRDEMSVWGRPGYMAIAIALAICIQRIEQTWIRKKTAAQTQIEFAMANKVKRVQADPKAVPVAKIKAEQHNAQGMGEQTIGWSGVALTYAIELYAFMRSFNGANFGPTLIYGFLVVFGFELFDRFTHDESESLVFGEALNARKPRRITHVK